MYMDLIKVSLSPSFPKKKKETQTPATGARLAITLLLVLDISEMPRSNDSEIGGTNNDGFHITDKRLAVGLGVAATRAFDGHVVAARWVG